MVYTFPISRAFRNKCAGANDVVTIGIPLEEYYSRTHMCWLIICISHGVLGTMQEDQYHASTRFWWQSPRGKTSSYLFTSQVCGFSSTFLCLVSMTLLLSSKESYSLRTLISLDFSTQDSYIQGDYLNNITIKL